MWINIGMARPDFRMLWMSLLGSASGAGMPKYFFHVYNDVVAVDDEGIELPDVGSAHQLALKSARALACDDLMLGKLNLSDRIDVEDEDRRPVLTLPFRAAFQIVD